MPKFNVKRRMPYTADQVYAIAANVAAYKEFLPLVRRVVVSNRRTLPDGREAFDAEMTVTYKKLGIEETTVSQVIADPVVRLVVAHSEQGAVKSLDAQWRIESVGPTVCDIDFTVDYTLKSRSLQFLLSGMFDFMVRKIMAAFEERAKRLYGPRAASS